MTFQDLLESSQQDDMRRRLSYLATRTDKQLAQLIANPASDFRDYEAAKQLLKQHGVQGIPE